MGKKVLWAKEALLAVGVMIVGVMLVARTAVRAVSMDADMMEKRRAATSVRMFCLRVMLFLFILIW